MSYKKVNILGIYIIIFEPILFFLQNFIFLQYLIFPLVPILKVPKKMVLESFSFITDLNIQGYGKMINLMDKMELKNTLMGVSMLENLQMV